ncbi:MAG: hypothetical protein OXI96_07980 [Acidimicrobiaceae bacterium]|nr:hypothetical protein [Acidimicrobiaceae bacterium]
MTEFRAHVCELWGDLATSRIEVRCHGQASMDILVTTPTELIAVEAKLYHSRHLIVQAFLHRYCVDFVYIAVPEKRVIEARSSEAANFGIGVIAVANGSTRIIKEARRAKPTQRIRQRLIKSDVHYASAGRNI